MVYDLIVLGGGPAGYLGAERAAAEGYKVLLFEKRNVGGVCLNEGCIPSKAFLNSAKLKDGVIEGEPYGIRYDGNITLDHPAVVKHKDRVVKTLTGGVAATLKGLGVEWVKEEATIAGRTKNGYKIEAGGKNYEGARLLIATGSEAAMPPIPGLAEQYDAGFAITSREILDIQEIPEKLAVIGGGVIGLEMASYFSSAGSEVTVVEMLDHIGGEIDLEISGILQRDYAKKGIIFKTGCKVTEIKKDGVVYEQDGTSEVLDADKVLVSVGRTPTVRDVGFETIDLLIDKGAVVTDEAMRTNQPNVYAAGDVNGHSLLAHTAYREAEVAVNNMVGKKDRMKYLPVPNVIYTSPEVAGVGETEQSAKDKHLDVTVEKISMRYAGRYVAENARGTGICKIIVDNKWNTLIGLHMITPYASEIIWGASALVDKELNIEEIKKLIFPHPTVSEIIREAIFQL